MVLLESYINSSGLGGITTQCMDWCRDEHYAFSNQFIWLIIIALVLMVIAKILYNSLDTLVAKTQYTEEQIAHVIITLNTTAMYLILLYFIMQIFFGYETAYELHHRMSG